MPETNPYTPPEANIEIPQPNRRKATRLAKVGAWMQLLPVSGLMGIVVGMARNVAELGRSGAQDVAALSASIGELLVATSFGFIGGLIGFMALSGAVFLQKRQPLWVWVVFWIASLPAIYIVGLLLLAAAGSV